MLRVSMAPDCGLIRAKGPALFLAQPEGLGAEMGLTTQGQGPGSLLGHSGDSTGCHGSRLRDHADPHLGTQWQGEDTQIGHAHAAREHGTRHGTPLRFDSGQRPSRFPSPA